MRRNKKGDLSLSINAIIILILAITMLGLGLSFIRGLFTAAEGKVTQVTSATEIVNPPTRDTPLTLTPSDTTVRSKKRDKITLSFLNSLGDKKWCKLLILADDNSEATGITTETIGEDAKLLYTDDPTTTTGAADPYTLNLEKMIIYNKRPQLMDADQINQWILGIDGTEVKKEKAPGSGTETTPDSENTILLRASMCCVDYVANDPILDTGIEAHMSLTDTEMNDFASTDRTAKIGCTMDPGGPVQSTRDMTIRLTP